MKVRAFLVAVLAIIAIYAPNAMAAGMEPTNVEIDSTYAIFIDGNPRPIPGHKKEYLYSPEYLKKHGLKLVQTERTMPSFETYYNDFLDEPLYLQTDFALYVARFGKLYQVQPDDSEKIVLDMGAGTVATNKDTGQTISDFRSFYITDLTYDRAQFLLGLCFLEGNGIEQNSVQAVELLTKAAKQGHSGAKEELANRQFGVVNIIRAIFIS